MSQSLIIGCGNLGKIIIDGFEKKEKTLIVYDKRKKTLEELKKKKYKKIIIQDKLKDIIWKNLKYVMICVKPKDANVLFKEINNFLTKNNILISFAAGLLAKKICQMLGKQFRIIRLMPNVFVKVEKSATGAYKNFSEEGIQKIIENDFKFFGFFKWFKREDQMNFHTALYGGGPAYVCFFFQCLINISRKYGLESNSSREMVLSLLHGTSKFLELENIDFTEVINKVASKGGTTEEALSFFNNNKKLQSFLEKGISMAERKSRFLSGE